MGAGMDIVPKITREVLEGYLQCKTKGLLTLAGQSGTKPGTDGLASLLLTVRRTRTTAALAIRYRGRLVSLDFLKRCIGAEKSVVREQFSRLLRASVARPLFEFVRRRAVMAGFDGGDITSTRGRCCWGRWIVALD